MQNCQFVEQTKVWSENIVVNDGGSDDGDDNR